MQCRTYKVKKIEIPTSKNLVGTGFGYQKNQEILNFLPTFFVLIILSIALIFSFLSISIFSKHGVSSLPFSPSISLPSQQISYDNQNLDKEISNLKTGADLILEQERARDTIILRNNKSSCQLIFSQKSLENLKVTSSQQGFWLSDECQESSLDFIQVLKISDIQIIQDLKQEANILVQELDSSKNIFALAYLQNSSKLEFDLKDFARLLAIPVFPDKNWFSGANAFDTNRQQNKTFYLDEGCNKIDSSKECNLWVFDNFTGRMNILVENVENLAREIKLSGKSVKFARKQANYPLEIALITIPDDNIEYIELIRIEVQNGNLISKSKIDRQNHLPDFNTYFR